MIKLALIGLGVIYCVWRYKQWADGVSHPRIAPHSEPIDEFAGIAEEVEEFYRPK